jgi:hypothetical protein
VSEQAGDGFVKFMAEAQERDAVEAALAADREKGLRDVFAVAAMQAEINSLGNAGIPESEYGRLDIARLAFKMADVMMIARKE